MTLIDFTLSDARRFYSSMGNPLAVKGLTYHCLSNDLEMKLIFKVPMTPKNVLARHNSLHVTEQDSAII